MANAISTFGGSMMREKKCQNSILHSPLYFNPFTHASIYVGVNITRGLECFLDANTSGAEYLASYDRTSRGKVNVYQ